MIDIDSFAVDEHSIQALNRNNELVRSSVTAQYPRVNYWLAYPHYGIGYLMSNGCVGELMPDKSSLFFSPCRQRVLYNSSGFEDGIIEA